MTEDDNKPKTYTPYPMSDEELAKCDMLSGRISDLFNEVGVNASQGMALGVGTLVNAWCGSFVTPEDGDYESNIDEYVQTIADTLKENIVASLIDGNKYPHVNDGKDKEKK